MNVSALLALAAVVVLGSPVSAAEPARPTALGPTTVVDVMSISFEPNDITIAPGTTVSWRNDTTPDRVHDVVSSVTDYFLSPRFRSGESYQYRFTAAGSFGYVCSIHDVMIGVVHVPLTGRVEADDQGPLMRIRLATRALSVGSDFRYVVRRRDPGSPVFQRWLFTRAAELTFRPTMPGTYDFTMRIKNVATGEKTGTSGDSPVLSLDWPG